MTAPDLFLSIDFEDFSHDLGRDLGLWKTRPVRIAALTRAYEEIDRFARAWQVRLTFFCTGVIARDGPELIERIARDGHEIACHYHFHDCVDRHSPGEFDSNLQTGLALLREASGQPVTGFRAPKFRIPQDSVAHYEIVARHCAYDSSFLCNTPAVLADFRAKMTSDLKILPIFADRMRLGGSYLKLLPLSTTRRMIQRCKAAGLVPHIYLHPYEFISDRSFILSPQELAPLGRKAAGYWRLRQAQWHLLGPQRVLGKMNAIMESHTPGGRLDQNIGRLAA